VLSPIFCVVVVVIIIIIITIIATCSNVAKPHRSTNLNFDLELLLDCFDAIG